MGLQDLILFGSRRAPHGEPGQEEYVPRVSVRQVSSYQGTYLPGRSYGRYGTVRRGKVRQVPPWERARKTTIENLLQGVFLKVPYLTLRIRTPYLQTTST